MKIFRVTLQAEKDLKRLKNKRTSIVVMKYVNN